MKTTTAKHRLIVIKGETVLDGEFSPESITYYPDHAICLEANSSGNITTQARDAQVTRLDSDKRETVGEELNAAEYAVRVAKAIEKRTKASVATDTKVVIK